MTAVTNCKTASVCWLRGRRGSRAVGTGARTTLPRFATTVRVVCRFSLFMGLRIVLSTDGAARSPGSVCRFYCDDDLPHGRREDVAR